MANKEHIAEYLLSELKKAGADGAQCHVAEGRTDELNVDGGQFSLMRTLFDSTVALKCLVGGRKGTAQTNRLDTEALDGAVAACIASAKAAVPDEAESIAPAAGAQSFEAGPLSADADALFDRLAEFRDGVQAQFPKIILEQLITDHRTSDALYANTNGSLFRYRHGAYSFESMFSAHEGEASSSFNGYGFTANDLATPFMDVGMLRTLLAESEQSLQTEPVQGKFTGTVIVTPACLLSLLWPLFGCTILDAALIDGTSRWKDKLGQAVAHEGLTVSSRPLAPFAVAGERYTGEGYLSEDFDILKNGVLQSFGLSQYAAQKTGNARAKNLGFNIEVAAGATPLAQLIAGCKRGIVLNRFSGGAPGMNGDFSGVAKNSFLIENGKVAGAVSETMVNGNLLELVKNLEGISVERVADGSSLLPWVAFGGVTVTGKE